LREVENGVISLHLGDNGVEEQIADPTYALKMA
jgi:hypothetical protein